MQARTVELGRHFSRVGVPIRNSYLLVLAGTLSGGLAFILDPRSIVITLIFFSIYILLYKQNSTLYVSKSLMLSLTPLFIGGLIPNSYWYFPWLVYAMIFSVLIFRLYTKPSALDSESLINSNLILLLIFAVATVSKGISQIDAWAWQLRGDGINFIVSTRTLSDGKSLFSSVFLNGAEYGITFGNSFLIQWLSQQIVNITGGTNRDLSDLSTSFLGINILAWTVILVATLELSRKQPVLKRFLTAFFLVILIFSWINAGFTMYNGFLSIPLTISLVYLLFLNTFQNGKDYMRLEYIYVQIFLILILAALWSLIAIVPFAILSFTFIENYLKQKMGEQKLVIGHFLLSVIAVKWAFRGIFLALFFFGYLWLISQSEFSNTLLRTGAFPHISILALVASLIVLIVVFAFSQINFFEYRFHLLTIIGLFELATIIFFERASEGSVLRGLSDLWVTETYYLQKASWIIFVALFFTSISLLANRANYMALLLSLMVIVVQQNTSPGGLWNEHERKIVSYQGIAEIDEMSSNSRIMYFNFDNWLGDAYLNSLSGLQFESYTGHTNGSEVMIATTFMPPGSFAARSFYTDEKNALCVGQRLIGASGEIRTRDLALETKLLEWCGKGPFPKILLYTSRK